MDQRSAATTWLARITRSRSGQLALYGFALLEAAFVPIPFEAVLAPYLQMRPDLRWRLVAIGVAGYATVALLAYGLGSVFHETVARSIIERMGWAEAYATATDRLETGGFLAFAIIVALPIPTMPVHISAGALAVPVEWVLPAVILVRGARYAAVALLVSLYGDRVVDWFRGRRDARRRRRTERHGPP